MVSTQERKSETVKFMLVCRISKSICRRWLLPQRKPYPTMKPTSIHSGRMESSQRGKRPSLVQAASQNRELLKLSQKLMFRGAVFGAWTTYLAMEDHP